MLIRPLPGADRDSLLKNLENLHMEVGNIRSHGHTQLDLYNSYLSWVNESVRMLRHHVSPEDLERLVLTKRCWLLQSMAGSAVGPLAVLVETEIDDRLTVLNDARGSLEEQIKRWSRPGWFVVADTTVFCQAAKLEKLDLGEILGSRHDPVHLLVPMVIVDELDRLKQSSKKDLRWRAQYTLAVLDRVLSGASKTARLQDEDFSALDTGEIPRGEVTVEIVPDPPGHARLPINDDEIIDRALAIQSLSGRNVTLLTYDTGQNHRARDVGLKVKKLTEPIGEEPA
jgi:rRNA-processing protein FCF1